MSQDFTVKITQKGYDTGSAPDLNLLFSNKTNPLKTQKDVLFGTWTFSETTSGAKDLTVVEHNLGYRPVFIIIRLYYEENRTLPASPPFGPTPFSFVDSNVQRDLSQRFSVDKRRLYFSETYGTSPVDGSTFDDATGTYFYMIFRQQIDDKVSYPVESGGQSEPVFNQLQDFSIEMSRKGYDVNTAEIDDYIFNSKYPTLSVCKIDSPGRTGTITHGLGYIPFFLSFFEFTASDRMYQQGNGFSNSGTDYLTVTASSSGLAFAMGSTGVSANITTSWGVILRDYI